MRREGTAYVAFTDLSISLEEIHTNSLKYDRTQVRQQLPLINRELDGIMASLECETNGDLKAQEARIRVNEQNIFKLNEFIRRRSQESNYTDLKKKCMSLVQEINQQVIRSHRESMESLIGPGYASK